MVAASLSAALAPAKTAGSASVGAARARNLIGWSDNSTEQPLEVRAYLLDTSVAAPNGALRLSADAHQQIDATVGAASVAVTSGRNAIGLGGAGAESVNRISEQVAATIAGSAAGGVLARSASLTATDRSTIDADAGAAAIVAAISGSAGVALSVGVALAENRIANQVTVGGASGMGVLMVPYGDRRTDPEQLDGTLGLNFFAPYHVWADWSGRAIYLKPREDADDKLLPRLARWASPELAACKQPGCVTAARLPTAAPSAPVVGDDGEPVLAPVEIEVKRDPSAKELVYEVTLEAVSYTHLTLPTKRIV